MRQSEVLESEQGAHETVQHKAHQIIAEAEEEEDQQGTDTDLHKPTDATPCDLEAVSQNPDVLVLADKLWSSEPWRN